MEPEGTLNVVRLGTHGARQRVSQCQQPQGRPLLGAPRVGLLEGEASGVLLRSAPQLLLDLGPPERFLMAHRKASEILTAGRGGDGFKRLERRCNASKQPFRFVKFRGMK